MKEKPIIMISRQMGSGGTYIGYLTAKEMGFRYIDREILLQAANQLGVEPDILKRHDQRSANLIENFVQPFCFGTPETSCLPPLGKPIYGKDLFALESKIIKDVADKYSAVIVGRGGFYILKDRPNTINIFVHAPLDYRIERIMRVQKITDKREAQKIIEESDKERNKFVHDMVGVHWYDARNFHLCIDSSVIGFPACIEMITKLVNIKKVTDS